jgi:OOP family OmpA-OmpF porin
MSAWQRGQTPFNGQQSLSASAFRDPRLGARVALLRGEQLSLAAGLDLFVPLGSQTGYGSDGGFRALPQALASGRRGRLVYAGEVGLELRKRSDVSFTTTGSALRLGLAGGWLFLNDKLQVGPELFSSVQLNDASRTSLEALLGARYQRGDVAFGAGIGGRLNQHAPGAAPLRVLAQITFTGFDPFHARVRPFVAAPVAVAAAPVPAPVPPPVVVAEPPPAPKPVEVAVVPPPAPEPVPAPSQEVRVLEDHAELLHALRFEYASAVLDAQSQADLTKLAEALLARSDIKRVFVSGHSDNRGSAPHNRKLTARRAEAVRAHLVAHGVPASMLKSRGCGSTAPVAPNETDEGRAQNRRVEIVFPRDGVEPGCTN